MAKKDNTLPLLCIVAIVAAVLVALFSLKEAAQKRAEESSDDVTSIETDINSTNFDNVDQESAEMETLID